MSSHADFQSEWEGLVTAAKENAEKLPTAEPHRVVMEGTLNDFKSIKALQDTHRAGKQKATQDLGELLARGKEHAARLRGAIKADLGLKSEELIHYGISPVRPRTRRAVALVKPPVTRPAPHTPTAVVPATPDKTTA